MNTQPIHVVSDEEIDMEVTTEEEDSDFYDETGGEPDQPPTPLVQKFAFSQQEEAPRKKKKLVYPAKLKRQMAKYALQKQMEEREEIDEKKPLKMKKPKSQDTFDQQLETRKLAMKRKFDAARNDEDDNKKQKMEEAEVADIKKTESSTERPEIEIPYNLKQVDVSGKVTYNHEKYMLGNGWSVCVGNVKFRGSRYNGFESLCFERTGEKDGVPTKPFACNMPVSLVKPLSRALDMIQNKIDRVIPEKVEK